MQANSSVGFCTAYSRNTTCAASQHHSWARCGPPYTDTLTLPPVAPCPHIKPQLLAGLACSGST